MRGGNCTWTRPCCTAGLLPCRLGGRPALDSTTHTMYRGTKRARFGFGESSARSRAKRTPEFRRHRDLRGPCPSSQNSQNHLRHLNGLSDECLSHTRCTNPHRLSHPAHRNCRGHDGTSLRKKKWNRMSEGRSPGTHTGWWRRSLSRPPLCCLLSVIALRPHSR